MENDDKSNKAFIPFAFDECWKLISMDMLSEQKQTNKTSFKKDQLL